MIFKTINSDIDKWTSKIGVLGKSFNAIFDAKNQRKIDIDDSNASDYIGTWRYQEV